MRIIVHRNRFGVDVLDVIWSPRAMRRPVTLLADTRTEALDQLAALLAEVPPEPLQQPLPPFPGYPHNGTSIDRLGHTRPKESIMTLGVSDIVRTTVNFLLPNGVQYQNVYHHIFDGIGGVSDAAVVLDIKAWAEAAYDELVGYTKSTTVEQLSFVDQVEWVVNKWEVVANIGTFTPSFTPVEGTDICPNQVSAFVVFKTGRPKTVGRKFLFPAPEAAQNQGIMEAGYVTAVVAYAGIIVNDLELDVVNTLHPGVPRTAENDWQTFTVAVVTDLLGTQRRRRPGYGA